jgi:hypothetical protein
VIDFRFFLISIVAVFLALGIGIVMGSGVLGGPILEDLKSRADAVVERNGDLRREISSLETEQAEQQDFMTAVEAELVAGELINEDIVIVQVEGTDGALIDSIETLVAEGGGELATRIVLTGRFALDGDGDVEALAGILDSQATEPAALRGAAGTEIGSKLGASSSEREVDPKSGVARGQAIDMLEELDSEGFVTLDRSEDQPVIPLEALFVVAAGAESGPTFDPGQMLVNLAGRADDRGTNVVVTETTNSTWGVMADVRNDSAVSDQVSTVDHGDTIAGRVAIVWSLPAEREVGHWGTDDGADAVVPAPSG